MPASWKPKDPDESAIAHAAELVEQIIELMDRRRENETTKLVKDANEALSTSMTAAEFAKIPYAEDTRDFVIRSLRRAQKPPPRAGLDPRAMLEIAHVLVRRDPATSPEQRSHLLESFAINTEFPLVFELFDTPSVLSDLAPLSLETIVNEAIAFRPPTTPEELWELARDWAKHQSRQTLTLRGAFGLPLMKLAFSRLEVPELLELHRLAVDRRPLRLRTYMQRIGLAIAPSIAPAKRTSEPSLRVPSEAPTRKVRHAKFGEGVVVGQSMRGSDVVLEIDFGGERRKLLESFVTNVT